MDSNPFFRFLGRVNTVLITMAGLAVLVLVTGSALWWPLFGGAPAVAIHGMPADKGGNSFVLDGLEEGAPGTAATLPDGWNEAVMVLNREHAENPYGGSFSSDRGAARIAVNLLFVDLKTAGARWLFRGTDRCIANTTFVRGPRTDAMPNGAVTALLMIVADSDTNHDGRIDAQDAVTLYLYRPGALAARNLLAAKTISDLHQIDAARVLVTYYDGKADRVALFSTDDYRLLASGPLAVTPP